MQMSVIIFLLFHLKLKQKYALNVEVAMLSITVDILNLSEIST